MAFGPLLAQQSAINCTLLLSVDWLLLGLGLQDDGRCSGGAYHSQLLPLLRRLIGDRKKGYVLADLKAGAQFGDRAGAIRKRFTRLRTDAGIGAAHVFHSIRKTVVTLLDNAGVSENVAADIVGHDKPRITYGLYSGGASLEVKRAALEKLRY